MTNRDRKPLFVILFPDVAGVLRAEVCRGDKAAAEFIHGLFKSVTLDQIRVFAAHETTDDFHRAFKQLHVEKLKNQH